MKSNRVLDKEAGGIDSEYKNVAGRSSAIVIMVSVVAFTMGNTMLFALVGPIARRIGLSEFQVGVIFSASALMFLLSSPTWGRLTDRWGRRQVIVIGLFGSAGSTLLFAAALAAGLSSAIGASVTFAALLGSRVLYGILCAGIQPASVAYMADVTDARNRSAGVALVGTSTSIGTILGPVFAAIMVGVGLLAPLLVVALLTALTGAAAARVLREAPRVRQGEAHGPAAPISVLMPYLGLTLATYTALAALQQTIAFYLQDLLGGDARDAARAAGYCFGAFAAAALIAQIAVVRRLKPTPRRLLTIGFPLLLIGVIAYAVAPSLPTVLLAFATIGAGSGLVQPGLLAAASLVAGTYRQGSAASYVQAAMAGGYIIGPLAGTASYEVATKAPAVFAAVCLALALAGFLAQLRGTRVASAQE